MLVVGRSCRIVDALAHNFPAVLAVLLEQWLHLPCVGCRGRDVQRLYEVHVASGRAHRVDPRDRATCFLLGYGLLERLVVLVGRVERKLPHELIARKRVELLRVLLESERLLVAAALRDRAERVFLPLEVGRRHNVWLAQSIFGEALAPLRHIR